MLDHLVVKRVRCFTQLSNSFFVVLVMLDKCISDLKRHVRQQRQQLVLWHIRNCGRQCRVKVVHHVFNLLSLATVNATPHCVWAWAPRS